ncbi:Outer membrane protein (porin) [Marinobacter segnicrescens]|uniref:Outer membrane protein (Porin) n=1 Tax=Marinobacter segnicrescens TaxID=430453 RepID=A0A1I0FGB4_9GAMM|nr:porin [Marinobacter segnicrescens]SET56971.1 Outer membrane protein (porin) [Marinobacter segnicrescens]
MKKLLLAAAVSVAAGSANAATVYENGGLSYKVNGDFQIQFRQATGHEDDNRAEIEYDDLELKNFISYDLGNDLAAFGRLDFGFKDAAEDDENGSNLEEAFVGLKYGVASVSFGKQNFATDEFGIEEAIEVETIDEDRFDDTGTDGDDTIRVDVELDKVYFAASHEMDASDDDDGIDGEFYDLFVATDLAGLELAAAYQVWNPVDLDDSVGTWGLSASYDFGFMNLAADYSVSDWSDVGTWEEEDMTQYNVAAVFPVASTTDVALGMGNKDSDAWKRTSLSGMRT